MEKLFRDIGSFIYIFLCEDQKVYFRQGGWLTSFLSVHHSDMEFKNIADIAHAPDGESLKLFIVSLAFVQILNCKLTDPYFFQCRCLELTLRFLSYQCVGQTFQIQTSQSWLCRFIWRIAAIWYAILM